MALVPREPSTLDWDHFMWPEAVTWFARGMGAAREGDVRDARVAEQRLGELEAAASKAGEPLFTRNIRVLHLGVGAWLAQARHDGVAAAALMRQAADLEASTPKHAVTPAPTLPACEQLRDLLLEQQQPAAALAAYQRSPGFYPRRFNSLLGAARAAGHDTVARAFYVELLEVADATATRPSLGEARDVVAQGR